MPWIQKPLNLLLRQRPAHELLLKAKDFKTKEETRFMASAVTHRHLPLKETTCIKPSRDNDIKCEA